MTSVMLPLGSGRAAAGLASATGAAAGAPAPAGPGAAGAAGPAGRRVGRVLRGRARPAWRPPRLAWRGRRSGSAAPRAHRPPAGRPARSARPPRRPRVAWFQAANASPLLGDSETRAYQPLLA